MDFLNNPTNFLVRTLYNLTGRLNRLPFVVYKGLVVRRPVDGEDREKGKEMSFS